MSVVSVPNPTRITTTDLISLSYKVRGLSLQSSINRALQTGHYSSSFKGRGMEYNESRLYQTGDDIRNIDWRVTARTNKVHSKLFCEERERPVHIWIDFRAPMFFATRGKYKSVIAAELAALFAWIANQQGDRVGGMVITDTVQHELKAQRGKAAVLKLIKYMVEHPVWMQESAKVDSQQELSSSLVRLRQITETGGLVILLSDFRGFDEATNLHLRQLSQRNKLIMVHIFDWLEASLPPPGNYRIRHGEEELVFDSGNKKWAASHINQFNSHQTFLLKTARRCHANFLTCRTQDEPYKVIKKGLRSI